MFKIKIAESPAMEIYLFNDNLILKRYKPSYPDYDIIFETEVNNLRYLNSKNIDSIPKLLKVDNKNTIMYMSYCGERISHSNKPINWKSQLKKIINDLKSVNFYHNDVVYDNVCVKEGKVYLIDFNGGSIGRYNPKKHNTYAKIERNSEDIEIPSNTVKNIFIVLISVGVIGMLIEKLI